MYCMWSMYCVSGECIVCGPCTVCQFVMSSEWSVLGLQDLQGANSMLSVGPVVTTSVGMCDIDIRPVSHEKHVFYITI